MNRNYTRKGRYMYQRNRITKGIAASLFLIFTISVSIAGPIEKDNSLIGFWDLRNCKSNVAKDISGNGNDGNIHGTKQTKEGLFFDGINDYIDCGNSSLFDITDEFTIEAWIKPEAFPDIAQEHDRYGVIISKGCAANKATGSYNMSFHRIKALYCFVRDEKQYGVIGNALSGNEWLYTACVFKNGTLNLYLNGNLTSSKQIPFSSLYKNKNPLFIGKSYNGKNDNYCGTVSTVKLYNKALAPSFIKSSFDKDRDRFQKGENQNSTIAYNVQKPNERIAESWKELKKYNLALVPCPKKIKVNPDAIPWPDNWLLDIRTDKIEAGIEEINRVAIETGHEAFKQGTDAYSNVISIGLILDMKDLEGVIDIPASLPPQGYIIRFVKEKNRNRIILAGTDADGIRYACVTFSMLLQGQSFHPVDITDWPDFKYRAGFVISGDFEKDKEQIDQAFRCKMNMMFGGGAYTTIEKMLLNEKEWKKTNEYAKQRGIKTNYSTWSDVGEAPNTSNPNAKCYPYNGMVGYLGLAYTWSHDNLLDQKGKLMVEFLRRTGAGSFYIHPMDTGGKDNPENWNFRSESDKKRFGDDRAAADANVMNIFNKNFKEYDPECMSISVVYPYGAKYLKYPDIVTWVKRLATLADPSIYFCMREGPREDFEAFRKVLLPHNLYVYYQPYPWEYRMLFSSTGRYVRTFYSDKSKDVIWFYVTGRLEYPQVWVASEYAWNTQAPGWGWLPEDYYSIKNADFNPKEISEELLPRIMTLFYGEKAADPMSEVYSCNFSSYLPSSLARFSGGDPEEYFKSKYILAENALVKMKKTEPFIKKTPFCINYFNETKNYIRKTKDFSEARYLSYIYRKNISEEKFTDAELIGKKAIAILSRYKNDRDANNIAKDFDSKANITWTTEKKKFISENKPAREISIGIYSREGAVYKGILESFSNIQNIKVSLFDDPTKEILKNFNVILFPACTDIKDPTEDWRQNVIKYVADGGGVIFSHNATGRYQSSALGKPLFPEVCAGFGGQVIDRNKELKLVVSSAKHPIVEKLNSKDSFKHEYFDHCWLKNGDKGEIILSDESKNPVMLAGTHGKGKVIYTGQIFGLARDSVERGPVGDEYRILYISLLWAAGK